MAAPKLPTIEQLLEVPRAELISLRANVDEAIKQSEVNARNDAKAKIEALAKESGFSLSDLFGTASDKPAKTKTPAAPKFKHPENADITWSGRGRSPDWVKAHIEAGGSKDDLAI